MTEPKNSFERFDAHHERLVDAFLENRNAVMDPTKEYDSDDFVAFARESLLPHTMHEEAVLYDRVDELIGTGVATAGLREDHAEIERRVDTLAESTSDGASLPLELHELSALVVHHFQTEELILIPYLERSLPDEEFAALLETVLEHDEA